MTFSVMVSRWGHFDVLVMGAALMVIASMESVLDNSGGQRYGSSLHWGVRGS
jgi:hypothetical protein